MSFLAPLFLIGSLALAGPILFHLIRRTTKEQTQFSSLMFLFATPPRLTRRSRIEHWLLLALRCLALGLMALGFARPFLKQPPSGLEANGTRQRIVLLLDSSASMRRDDLWNEARRQAEALAQGAGVADEVAVLTFARSTEVLVSIEDWQRTPVSERAALVKGRLADRQPGWLGTHLGAALIRASDLLAESAGKEAPGIRRVVLFSDLQSGSHLEVLQSYEWPKEMELVVAPLAAKKPGNASVQWLPEAGEADSLATNQVRVRISNTSDAKSEQFQVNWANAEGTGLVTDPAPVAAYVPAGQNRTLRVVVPTNGVDARRILLTGDGQPFDNLVHVVPPEPVRSSVIYWGTDSTSDRRQPASFLRETLPATRRQFVTLIARTPEQPVTPAELEAAVLYVVTGAIPAETAAEIRRRVMGGKLLLVALRNPAMAATASQLVGVESLPVSEAVVRDYAMLGTLDFRHPCFAPFADPRFSDFTRIHFWKYRQVSADALPGARVVAGFDSGDPALLEIPAGRGRILLLTSGWNPEDSQFALSTKFVPFIYSILEMAGGAVTTTGQTLVGDAPELPAGFVGDGTDITLQGPSGAPVSLGRMVTNLPVAEVPGVYSLRAGKITFRYTANLDPLESRTVPLSVDELERWGAPVRHPTSPAAAGEQSRIKTELQSQEAEGRQKLWRWFVVATLAVLLGETVIAGWTARKAGAA